MAEAQNIPVGSTTAGQIAVAAESTVATRMSAPPSFDVADFPVPTAARRVAVHPLERLRGLHDGTAVATGDGLKVDVEAPAGVVVETVGRDDARLGRAGTPVDRVAAQAYSAFEKAGVITVPKETVLTEPIRVAVHGEGGSPTATRSWSSEPSPRPWSSSTTPVTPCSRPTSTTSWATAPSSPSSPSGLGRQRRARGPAQRADRPGRHVQVLRGHLRRRPRAPAPARGLRRHRW